MVMSKIQMFKNIDCFDCDELCYHIELVYHILIVLGYRFDASTAWAVLGRQLFNVMRYRVGR